MTTKEKILEFLAENPCLTTPEQAARVDALRESAGPAKRVGTGEFVVLGLSSAGLLMQRWQRLERYFRRKGRESDAQKDHIVAATLDGCADGLELCIEDLRRRIAAANERQPQHNI